jgi:NAD(P)-dependent dehydrogenase (short-subunit alcohol dehydrogenase family)
MSSAAGRTVLVTGAARRLGRSIALELAAAGWQVAVHYRSSAAEAQKTAAECSKHAPSQAFEADLAIDAQVRGLLPRVIQRFGTLDAVVNNASRFEHDDAQTFTAASLAAHVASNTAAPILLAQALHAHLKGRGASGCMVNLLDQKLWNPNPDFLSYTLSKAALEAATTLLAQALAPQLRVVGVAPGLTLTSHMLSQEKFEQLHKLSPLGRSSTPEDIAHAVRFALENPAITGTTLLVDGGQHLMKFDRDFSLM